MDELDRRARSAVADVRAAVVVTDENELLPSRRGAATIALLSVVVVAAGIVLLTRDDEQVVASAARVPGELRLAPTPVPDGVELFDVRADGSAEAHADGWWRAFGAPGADPDLFVDLNTVPLAGGDDEIHVSGPYDEVDVGGTTAYIVDLPLGGRSLLIVIDQRMVVVHSGHLGDDVLVAVAGGITLDADRTAVAVDPAALPDGFEPVATVEQVGLYGAGIGSRAGASSTMTSWTGPEPGVDFTVSAADRADADVELFNRASLGNGAVARTVHGRPALQSADGQTVLWREADDVIVELQTSQAHGATDDPVLSAEDVLALADAVAPVDADTWAAMLDAVPDEVEPSPTTVLAGPTDALGIPVGIERLEATLDDGRRNVVYRDPEDGRICAVVGDGGGGSSTCSDPADGPQVMYEGGRPAIVFGLLPPGATHATASVGGTELLPAGTLDLPDGVRLFAFFLLTSGVDEAPAEVVYRDDAGTEVGREAPVNP